MLDTRHEDVLNVLEQLHRHVRPEGEAVYRKLERGFAEFTTEIETLKLASSDLSQFAAIDKWKEQGFTRQEGLILDALERAKDRGLTRDGILTIAYADKIDPPQVKTVDVMIMKIRDKLTTDSPFHIETVWGMGYRMVRKAPSTAVADVNKFDANKYQAA